MDIVIALGFGVAAALAAVTVLAIVGERAETRRSLRALEGYQIAVQRDQEMLATFGDRILTPFSKSLTGWLDRFTPSGYREKLGRKVTHAGNPPGLEVDRLIIFKALGAASVIVWFPLVFILLAMKGLMGYLMFGVLWGGSFMLADIMLDRKIDERKVAIARELPDLLDLLVISVEAGLAFEQALERTSNTVPGYLSEEFRRMLQESRLGAGRADRCARSTSVATCPSCGRSSWRCCRPTPSVCRSARSCARRPRRSAFGVVSSPRRRPRRHR